MSSPREYKKARLMSDSSELSKIPKTPSFGKDGNPYDMNVIEYIAKLLEIQDIDLMSRSLTTEELVKVEKFLKDIVIETTHGRARRYKVSQLTNFPLKDLKFSSDDNNGKMINVVKYFSDRYDIKLKYKHWPAFEFGTDARPVYVPLEVCKIAQKDPSNNKEDNTINKMVNARILSPPTLMYNENEGEPVVNPVDGHWNMHNKKVVNGENVNGWTCVNFSSIDKKIVDLFCGKLVKMCCNTGMVFSEGYLSYINGSDQSGIEDSLLTARDESINKLKKLGRDGNQLQLLIVILPEKDVKNSSYGTIKRVCETGLGLVSQCFKPKVVKKVTDKENDHLTNKYKQYLGNVALKINVKVGGINVALKQEKMTSPTIVFGAHINHKTSIAAVVGSMDGHGVAKYKGSISRQEELAGKENIQDLAKMIKKLLESFMKLNNERELKSIIFYRNGVSDGQLNNVRNVEVPAIFEGCGFLKVKPSITYIVVNKSCNTRLFPTNANDRTRNIEPAGTVIDEGICHKNKFDFFLRSHAGINATSNPRPTYYHVLYDTKKFTADELQTFTNNLCYTNARSTCSVSIVPAASYARLLALRASCYIQPDNVLPPIKDEVKENMFYC